jgi:hypothetical protein
MEIFLPGSDSAIVAARCSKSKLFFAKENKKEKIKLPIGEVSGLSNPVANTVISPAKLFFSLEKTENAKIMANQGDQATASDQDAVQGCTTALIAKSYRKFSGSDGDLLWKLHLRHGHRNFVDVARHYNLPIPIPACSSCIWAKVMLIHILEAHLIMQNGLARFSRRFQRAFLGSHSARSSAPPGYRG